MCLNLSDRNTVGLVMKTVISCNLRGFRFRGSGLVLAACLVCAAPLRADVFHLDSGGRVDGELVEKADGNYRIRTTVGTISVPIASVKRIEKKATPFAEYDKRAAKVRPTAKAHFALAEWCGEHDLLSERRKHLEHAIALDTDFVPAREALGFVKEDGKWIIPQPPAPVAKPAPAVAVKNDQPDVVEEVAIVQGRYTRQIRALMNGLLKSRNAKLYEQGRERILKIDDPRAILPLSRELGNGNLAMRSLLVESLTRFDDDEATLNLAVLGLVEENETLRHQIINLLLKRDDPRVVSQYRRALHADGDVVVANAAYALGRFKAESAVPDLIGSLKAQRERVIEVTLPGYFASFSNVWHPQRVPSVVDRRGVRYPYSPEVGVLNTSSGFSTLQTRLQRANVIVMRTEVLEALKKITGQNFGFNVGDWTRWYNNEWLNRVQEN